MISCMLFRPVSGWLVAALLTASSSALAHGEDPLQLWAAVPDSDLSQMRGGLDLGFLVANFAIERAVRINGETVSLTRLVITDLPNLLRGGVPGVQLSGDLANLIQVGQGNARAEAINSATQAAVAEMLNVAAPSAQATPAPANPSAPGNSGVVSSSNAANLQSQFGPGLAQAVALANGEGGVQPPAPIATPSASAPAPTAQALPAQGLTPQAPNPPAANWQAATSQAASAAASGAGSAAGSLTTSIAIPIGNTGQIINVTSIPNAAAFATSIQNSVQATRIDTETSISASLSSLAALRSSNFAAAMRQQAIDSVRR